MTLVYWSLHTFVISEPFGPVWDERDAFDEILQKFYEVNEDNCAIKHVGDLKMPEDTVSHLPDIKEININPVFPNRCQYKKLFFFITNGGHKIAELPSTTFVSDTIAYQNGGAFMIFPLG
jgi:hypothetical protein